MEEIPKKFKGWTVPRPYPERPGLAQSWIDQLETELKESITLDSICGDFQIFQLKNGHRYSTDDLLTAWYGSSFCPSARRVLDMGSGIGSVATVVAWRLPAVQVTTIEAQQMSFQLAQHSMRWNGIEDRVNLYHGDLRDSLEIAEQSFDLVLGSPPYFDLDSGVLSEHPQKVACRFETRGNVLDYCLAARKYLAPAGVFSCIFPIEPEFQRQKINHAIASAGLKIIRLRPIYFRMPTEETKRELQKNPAPLLALFLLARAEDLPDEYKTWEDAPLYIRDGLGQVHPEYAALKLSIGFRP